MSLHILALSGLFGGFVRGLVGVVKALKRGEQFRPAYFILTLVASALVGALAGMLVKGDFRIALLAG